MDYSLSDSDLRTLGKSPPNVKGFQSCTISIIPYEHLDKVQSVDEIVSPNKPCILLYQETPSSGHWVALFFRNRTLHFFDPYGVKPDLQQTMMSNSVRNTFYSNPNLVRLMYESPYPIDYNHMQFQKDGNHIATCGRHCIVRLWNRSKTTKSYGNWVKTLCKRHKISPDELVYVLT